LDKVLVGLGIECGTSSSNLWILNKIFFWAISVSSGGVTSSDGIGHLLVNTFWFFFLIISLYLSVEGGASSGDLWVLNEIFFWAITVSGGGVTLSNGFSHLLVDS
jgi:hypothetical protein